MSHDAPGRSPTRPAEHRGPSAHAGELRSRNDPVDGPTADSARRVRAAAGGRSPWRVAFSDKTDHEHRRGAGSTSSSSSSSSSSRTSPSASSRSDSDRRHSSSRRSGSRSRHRNDRHDRSARQRTTSRKVAAQELQHHLPSASASTHRGPAPGTYPAPQLALHPDQGLTAGLAPLPAAASVPLPGTAAVLLPPGHLHHPPSPVGTPTKAYASPNGTQGPAPTLLVSAYGNQPAQPVSSTSGAQQHGGSGMPPAWYGQPPQHQHQHLLDPMQALSLHGAPYGPALSGGATARARDASAHADAQAGPFQHPPPQAQLHLQQQQQLQQYYGQLQAPLSLPVLPTPQHAYQRPGDGASRGLSVLYDETTQEVIMADDVMVKELSRQGHVLIPLQDAYRVKLAALQASVNGQLLSKRDALLQQHARLSARAGEVASQRAALERQIAALAEDMSGRLRSAESLKQALLGRDQAEVGRDLDAIQRLLADIVAASAAGPVEFLNKYRPLADTCTRLVAKPFKSEVDVAADDLPAEAAVHADLAAAHDALSKLLAVKDQMIAHLLQERAAMQDELQQVVERYGSELTALESQCQGYYERLLALGAGDTEAGGGSTQGSPAPAR